MPNAVATGISADGQFNIFNRYGSVDVVVDVAGYYTPDSSNGGGGVDQDVLDRLDALEAENEELKTLLAGASRDGDTLTFEGVNLQLVNGEGSTDTTNGLGNLIVGYNEDPNDPEDRTGSHNIIIGPDHDYTAYSGLAAGDSNEVLGRGSVAFGQSNTAEGDFSSVTGGASNDATGSWSSVTGGQANEASGSVSSVSGGAANTAVTDGYTVVGGDEVLCIDLGPPNPKVCGEGVLNPVD